ncbi:MAG TPA: hypothetical protein VMB34_02080 [Acetobacteraceae bacterium]|nr:hypothetical protein [Acetobacteraceae bacterium]
MRQAVLVLGMHRSGTSAIAGISCLLGAAAPTGVMEAAFDNPTGFWESLPIASLNESILQMLDAHWFDSLRFDGADIDVATRQTLGANCVTVLRDEFGDTPCFVVKDPRFSLLLQLWLPVFEVMNVMVAPVLALRHPAEVTASLKRRDNMPIEVAAPMWLHYSLEAERLTRDRPRTLLSYDRLLRDWRGAVARIATETGLAWPVAPETVGAVVDDFLRPQMRHHHASPARVAAGKPPLNGWIAETYDALRAIETGADTRQFERLDRIRAAFAEWRADTPHITMEMAGGRQPVPPIR